MMSLSKSESTPFLPTNEGDAHDRDEESQEPTSTQRSAGLRLSFSWLLAVQLLVVVNVSLLLIIGSILSHQKSIKCEPDLLSGSFSAQSSIKHSIQHINTHADDDIFAGQPRPQVDQAWSELLRSSMIKVSAEELRSMNETSVPFKDGSGYVAYPETLHLLHCVKRIYQYQHLEYYKDVAEANLLTRAHWEHCLQAIRKGIMCNAEPTINTYTIDPSDPQNLKGVSATRRKCADWSTFEAWAYQRRVLDRQDVTGYPMLQSQRKQKDY